MVSWIYLGVFFIIYVPLFSWWVPVPDAPCESGPFSSLLSNLFVRFNQVWAGVLGIAYLIHLVETFIYVGDRGNGVRSVWNKPRSSRSVWKARGALLGGITLAMVLGYGALQILEMMELARVKPLEYCLCIIPIQINIGIMISTKWQKKMEKRAARKAMSRPIQVSDAKMNIDNVLDESIHGINEKVPSEGAIVL